MGGVDHPCLHSLQATSLQLSPCSDKERGVVWEESIILAPQSVRFAFLSATIPNAREFADWVAKIHGSPCHVVYTGGRLCCSVAAAAVCPVQLFVPCATWWTQVGAADAACRCRQLAQHTVRRGAAYGANACARTAVC